VLAALDDAAGEAKAHAVHATALVRLGAIGASEAALDRALAAARRAGDRRRANAVLAGAPPAALWGPSPVSRARGRCLDVGRGVRAEALARRGEHGAAIELARAAVDIAVATDALLDHADARVALATALRAAGRADDAAREQRRAVELWEAKGATLLAPDGAE